MRKLSYFNLLFVALFGGLLTLESYIAFTNFRQYQQQLSQKTVDSVAQEIAILIDNLGRKVQLFTKDKNEILTNLYAQPNSVNYYQQLQTEVNRWFPEAYNFAITNLQGNPILPHTQHLKNCFAGGQNLTIKIPYQVKLHTIKPVHFDIIGFIQKLGIFYISVHKDNLLRLLQNAQIPGHQLILFDSNYYLDTQHVKPLSNQSVQNNAAIAKIQGTDWQVADWPQQTLYQQKLQELSTHAILLFIVFSIIGWLLWNIILKAEQAGGRAFQVLTSIEQERRRIAMDMHDQILSELTHIGRNLASFAQQTSPPLQTRLYQTEAELTELSHNIRNIIDNLHPQALEMLGLESALRSYLEKCCIGEQTPNYHLDIGTELNLSQSQALGVYRIILETVNNSLKHADCDNFRIDIYQQEQYLFVSVEDDGKGLNLRQARRSNSCGLANISTRSRMLNAKIQWGKPHHFTHGTRFELQMFLGDVK
ncbi:histidine kinase [Candidatus Halobeggiatoa sp. HSG11]|nr:histidine kinase [Candidatus Halobeggiatoa sp. HSG11]